MNYKIALHGLFLLFSLQLSNALFADTGYDLWLRYDALPPKVQRTSAKQFSGIHISENASPTLLAAANELQSGLQKILGKQIAITNRQRSKNIVLATPTNTAELIELDLPLDSLGNEGFIIQATKLNKKPVTLIAANTDIGLLYGAFELLRQLQTKTSIKDIYIVSAPHIQHRVLNHWDNLDRSVERGYAGQSLWDWWRLPDFVDPRYRDYARANASIGINGTVLNNVNASALSLTEAYLQKASALADVLRPYGIKIYLTARFSAPIELGNLKTADPLNPEVRKWWKDKADEIYRVIPDFGGFLVKANSEGQPGPQDYGRDHADGANMMAEALAPHGGVVMWRAFVYSEHDAEDRAKQAFNEFKPLDEKFADNVMVQVKNGAIDFQPREPFHPMFGAFPNTPLVMEFQITKEYLGFDTHLVYLGPLYEEVLKANIGEEHGNANVASVIDGSLHNYTHTGIAGVANIGTDQDWTGSIFNQANWYVFGRLAWNPEQSSEQIAKEWIQQTLSHSPETIQSITDMMMLSREAVVNYMTPLGLAHLMGTDHHYGPAPWVSELGRPEWNPVYYHKADKNGIGFDRTKSGSDALSQYSPSIANTFADPTKVNEKFLLWFHHLPWEFTLKSGDTLWHELIRHYDLGVQQVTQMQENWAQLEGIVDEQRYNKTRDLFAIQLKEAKWWRDASIAYFKEVSGRELPDGVKNPEHSLDYYRSLEFPFAPGND